MTTYLVELYRPRADGSGDDRETRARHGAEQLAEEGVRVRYVRSLFVPEDETCFFVYEAASADAVAAACRRARLEFERVVEAEERR